MLKKRTFWVKRVMKTSNAMDLPEGIFTQEPQVIAQELKESVFNSARTKGTKFQSAMSMLNFYINRAGKNMKKEDKMRLEQAKIELRKVFGRV